MADIKDWSNNAPENNQAPPDGWKEGMDPSAVNDTARETHAAVRRFAEDGSLFDWGDTITYVSGFEFTASGLGVLSERYEPGRMIRITGTPGTGTVYGQIRTFNAGNVVFEGDTPIANDSDLAVSLGPRVRSVDRNPVGMIAAFPYSNGAAKPVGWLPCNGGIYQDADYPELAALLGDSFGGVPGVSFGIPDMRGRAIVGEQGNATGVLPQAGDAWGAIGGLANVTLTADESGRQAYGIPGESISVSGTTNTPMTQNASYEPGTGIAALTSPPGGSNVPGTFSGSGSYSGHTITASNANASHENAQPFMVMRWFIRALP